MKYMGTESLGVTLFKWLQFAGYGAGILFFDYLDIPRDATLILSSLMIIDTITGSFKALRLDPKKFTSHELGMGVLKKLMTIILILATALLAKLVSMLSGIDIGIVHLLSTTIGIFGVAEFYSICQNIYVFRTGQMVTEYDAISLFIKAIQASMRQVIENFISKKP